MADRLSQALNCCRSKKTGVEEIAERDPMLTFKEMYRSLAHLPMDKICPKLKVCGTGILAMDPHVLHPFVRIHIIDLDKKKYLQKKPGSSASCKNGVAQFETFNAFKLEKDANEQYSKKAYKGYDKEVDFFLPMSTKLYDMRVSGTNFCQWDEEFIINEQADYIF